MATAKKRGRHWRCLVFSHYEYIDGKKEIRDINREFTARYVHGAQGPDRIGCGFEQ